MDRTYIIARLERIRNTNSGNPQYIVHTTDGSQFRTKPDASVAYIIDNSDYENVPVQFRFDNGLINGIGIP
ncbi:MAG TPA: hypothetical protein VHK27_14605 [Gammaproteobacteria bacterium]|nr:hypothetical protein [Gammaproteobacteria bacterium]